MNCFCPKCSANITPDLTDVPTEGTFLKCPECNAGYRLQKESFARRALHKGSETSCANCGSQLGATIYCPGCHAIYPDYYVTETSSVAKQKMAKLLASLKGSGKKKAISIRHEERRSVAPSDAGRGARGPGKPLTLAIAIIVLLALVGGGFYYYREKVEAEYAAGYVQALFVIKSSADYNIRLSTKRTSAWKSSMTSTAPILTNQEIKALNGGKTDTALLLKRIENPPKRLAASQALIIKYHDNYMKLHELNSTPPSSIDSFASSANNLEDEIRKSGRELKAGLPPKITDKLNSSLDRYKNLNDL